MAVTNYYTVNGRLRGEDTSGTRLGYLTDALGSVTATIASDGVVQNTYRYKPYGQQLAKTGVGVDPKFQHAGDTGSRKTGLDYSEQYNQYRHLDTTTGRWTSADELWPIEMAYEYCYGNPVTLVDPNGLWPTFNGSQTKTAPPTWKWPPTGTDTGPAPTPVPKPKTELTGPAPGGGATEVIITLLHLFGKVAGTVSLVATACRTQGQSAPNPINEPLPDKYGEGGLYSESTCTALHNRYKKLQENAGKCDENTPCGEVSYQKYWDSLQSARGRRQFILHCLPRPKPREVCTHMLAMCWQFADAACWANKLEACFPGSFGDYVPPDFTAIRNQCDQFAKQCDSINGAHWSRLRWP